jgi:hypothetical protein
LPSLRVSSCCTTLGNDAVPPVPVTLSCAAAARDGESALATPLATIGVPMGVDNVAVTGAKRGWPSDDDDFAAAPAPLFDAEAELLRSIWSCGSKSGSRVCACVCVCVCARARVPVDCVVLCECGHGDVGEATASAGVEGDHIAHLCDILSDDGTPMTRWGAIRVNPQLVLLLGANWRAKLTVRKTQHHHVAVFGARVPG